MASSLRRRDRWVGGHSGCCLWVGHNGLIYSWVGRGDWSNCSMLSPSSASSSL